jgi:hypothetical protein
MSGRKPSDWCFEFDLVPDGNGRAVPYGPAEELMVEVILAWARARDYEVGGGFRRAGDWRYPREGEWGYKFTVAAIDRDRLIAEAQAGALLEVIQAFAAAHGTRIEGGYHEYTDDDFALPDLDLEEDTD